MIGKIIVKQERDCVFFENALSLTSQYFRAETVYAYMLF